jgi:hypothetical protein
MLVSKLLAATMIAGAAGPRDAVRPNHQTHPSRRPDTEREAATRPASHGMPRRREAPGRVPVHS